VAAKKTKTAEAVEQEVIQSYKGFDRNLQCRGFQFESGKTYEHEGEVAACSGGFHACEYPLDVLDYYAPNGSRYFLVEQSGSLSRRGDDSKVASQKIKVGLEIGLPGLIKAAIEYTFSRAKPEGETATGDQGAASATGDQGAASATGTRGAASATGDQGAASATGTWGAASATGYQGAASATGDQGAASATGDQGAASATGYRGAAMASGYAGSVSGAEGNALFLVERDDEYNIVSVWAGIAGRDGIKPNTFYALCGGKPVEV